MQRQNRHGVYFIIPSMEMGRTFCSLPPKHPTDDPDYRIIRSRRSRHLHYYFYIRDPVTGSNARRRFAAINIVTWRRIKTVRPDARTHLDAKISWIAGQFERPRYHAFAARRLSKK